MNLNIDGQHVDVTPPLREYVNKKFVRITEHFDNVINAHVVLSVEKLQQKAEIQLHIKGKELHASAIDGDMYAAIDAVMDKLHRQVIKYKEKLHSHKDGHTLGDLDGLDDLDN